jgi:hypothetical protein
MADSHDNGEGPLSGFRKTKDFRQSVSLRQCLFLDILAFAHFLLGITLDLDGYLAGEW